MVNLEGVLSDSTEGLDKTRTYNFRGPATFANILVESGIDMVGLGNNHSGDYGEEGLKGTKEALGAAGVPYAYEDEVYILEKDGIKIAFLSLTITRYDQFEEFLKEKIASLRSEEGCNFVIMAFHYGWEYSYVHNKKQRLTSHYVINSGADLVVGTHPHVVQGIEVYKNRLILYSLGNFSFGGNQTIKPRSLEAYIAKVALTFEDGVFKRQQLTIIPVHTSGTSPITIFSRAWLPEKKPSPSLTASRGILPSPSFLMQRVKARLRNLFRLNKQGSAPLLYL